MRLNVLTFNIHKGLSLFNRRHTLPLLKERLGEELPDLIFLQEVQGKNEARALQFKDWPLIPQHEFLAGQNYYAAYVSNRRYTAGHHGNAILSRYPIVSVFNQNITDFSFEGRGLLHAKVALLDGRFLHCVCVHLSLFQKSRKKQMAQLVDYLKTTDDFENLPLIIAGDFNDWQNDAARHLAQPLDLKEVFVESKGKPTKSFPAPFPLLSLDRIYIRHLKPIAAHLQNNKEWRKISDHSALAASLEI